MSITVAELTGTLLIQFARAPEPGKVKTRMIPPLSPEQACELHRELVLWTCRNLLAAQLGTVQLSVAGSPESDLFDQCRRIGVSSVTGQRGGDLGERMHAALSRGLEDFESVLLVGSDSPEISPDYLRRAVDELQAKDVVLGPARDGGYVLVGVRQPQPGIFENIPWGSDRVMEATRERLRELRVSWGELEALSDIDRPEDLALWRALSGRAARGQGGSY